MVYNMTTGALVSGISLDTAAGGISYEQVGDRMLAKQEVAPGVYDQYFFTKKGVVQMQYNANLGNTYYAFNDAEWSWD
jgi:ribosomal protein L27